MSNDFFTRPQAAAYLGIKPQTLAVWNSTKRYELPYVKVGRLVKYRKADLDAFIQKRTVGATND
ncbi:MAG: DNA-binding protein [Candidimonas sp.]|nr:MAG: DNA-binding protein [Candidimonas sp.]